MYLDRQRRDQSPSPHLPIFQRHIQLLLCEASACQDFDNAAKMDKKKMMYDDTHSTTVMTLS